MNQYLANLAINKIFLKQVKRLITRKIWKEDFKDKVKKKKTKKKHDITSFFKSS